MNGHGGFSTIFLLAILLGLVVGSGVYIVMQRGASSTKGLVFEEQFRTAKYIFYCGMYPETESNCRLYVSRFDGSERVSMGITLDYGSQRTGLQLSPDHKTVLVVREREVDSIDGGTLKKTTLATATDGTEFGVYTGFPSFVPVARWLDSGRVELTVYPAGTLEGLTDSAGTIEVPEPQPLEKKIVNVH